MINKNFIILYSSFRLQRSGMEKSHSIAGDFFASGESSRFARVSTTLRFARNDEIILNDE